jgi:hypothetical protein
LPVIASTALVTDGSDARPVKNRVAKSVVTASPHHHDFLVATLSRDRSNWASLFPFTDTNRAGGIGQRDSAFGVPGFPVVHDLRSWMISV